jgi:hypothetical protein
MISSPKALMDSSQHELICVVAVWSVAVKGVRVRRQRSSLFLNIRIQGRVPLSVVELKRDLVKIVRDHTWTNGYRD